MMDTSILSFSNNVSEASAFRVVKSQDLLFHFVKDLYMNGNIFIWFRLKAFPDDCINMTQTPHFLARMTESIVGKREKAVYSYFFLFLTLFSKEVLPQCRSKWGLCDKGLTHYQTTNFRLYQTERVSRRQFQI